MQFNFQNEWLNQSMTGLYNQYLLPLTLAAFLERSFSKIVLFSATFHCVLCKLFWLVYCIPLLFFCLYCNKELNQHIVLHMKEQIFSNPCMHFISLSSQFLNSFQIYKRQFKIFSIFSVFADIPNPTLTPSVSISVIYPTFTNCHPRSCPTTAGADFDLFLVAQTIKNLPAIQET